MNFIESPELLLKFIDQLRKKGVLSFEHEGLRLTLSPEALFPLSNYKKKKADVEEQKDEGVYTPEQVLFWSTEINPDELKEPQ